VALRVGEVIEKNMIAVRIGPELRQIAVATPDYLKANGQPGHPRDLVHHRCIRWRWPGRSAPYAWEFFEHGNWFDVVVDGPIIVDSREAALGAVLDSIGIGFVVEDTVAELLDQGRLVKLLDAWCVPFPGLHLCYPEQRHMPPALRAFIDAIRSEA
jgi:DNA-binding transcriptional LysR family regulator